MSAPLVVIAGPTASGKTALALALARRFGGEIVSADSMQVYQSAQIATAKPTPEETGEIPYHLIDFVPVQESFSVAQYAPLARRCIEEIAARGHLPILCGGTGLYIDAVIGGLSYEDDSCDPAVRERLRAEAAGEDGRERQYARLLSLDPALAAALHPNNSLRVIRALEIYETTGVLPSVHRRLAQREAPDYRLCMLALGAQQRETLYRRIDARVLSMAAAGLFEEAAALLAASEPPATLLQAIGLKEFSAYFTGECTREQVIDTLQRQTRRYAKRQLTWFGRDKRYHWLMIDRAGSPEALAEEAAALVLAAGIRTGKEEQE